jgi:hypothetical protein
MNYGILVAVAEDGAFQIIGIVDNRNEAQELADNYIANGPESDCLAPCEFQIHKRGRDGFYTVIDHLKFAGE